MTLNNHFGQHIRTYNPLSAEDEGIEVWDWDLASKSALTLVAEYEEFGERVYDMVSVNDGFFAWTRRRNLWWKP